MSLAICARLPTALLACAACMPAFYASPAPAQAYPARPIRLIVPWPPGGGVDIAARTIQPKMAEQLGQALVVDNRAGASGVIGTQLAARSPADGYTILLGAAGPNAILPLINPKTPYDALKDFAEVAHFANTVYVLVVNPSLPANSIKELVAMAKAKPGKMTVGVSGVATPAHITGEFLRASSGIELVSVFYKGVAGAVVEVLGGQITSAIVTISPVLPHAKAGRLKVLAVTSGRRVMQLPDVPTIAESGYPGLEVVNWYGVLAPARTPRDVIGKLAEAVSGTVKSPEVRDRLIAAGLEVVESTPADYAAFRKRDLAMWARMIKDTNIRVE
jgi:tripartite-type tricarboxylate transporter receptor subunit TctC